ncbi:uncharacterized protein LOC124409588 [Diprion similis]|uniref:uncharacterized protein LOC124409588 n=1 Tax=Diprion similis TaxID=362088 RepID=UPI001EF7F7AE|nr:uncharacterized protein LOC124409588 [Diprion similis]
MSGEKIQLVRELHAPARRNFKRQRVIVKGFDDSWQADLVDMRQYAKINKNFNYILTVIDVLSKFAWAVALKNKSAQSVVDGFKEVLQSGRSPKNFQSDDERWNRTLKGKMWRSFSLNVSYKWINNIQQLVAEYNKSKHRTTVKPAKYKVGDFVRVSKYKTIFAKGYTPNWSTDIFRIQKVQNTNPRIYLLIDQ